MDFGAVVPGAAPAPVGERVTVSSNAPAGYALSLHRTAFAPRDLPLGVAASAPSGTQLAPPLAGGAVVGVPIAPAADLLLGTATAPSAPTRRRLADRLLLPLAAHGAATGPLHGVRHVHGDRPLIAAAVLAGALFASQTAAPPRATQRPGSRSRRRRCVPRSRRERSRSCACGRQAVVPSASRRTSRGTRSICAGGLGSSPRSTPRPGSSVRPRRVTVGRSGAALVVSTRRAREARAGDHSALVLLTTAAPSAGGVLVRMRIGLVVTVRVPGVLVHRVELRAAHVRRSGRPAVDRAHARKPGQRRRADRRRPSHAHAAAPRSRPRRGYGRSGADCCRARPASSPCATPGGHADA